MQHRDELGHAGHLDDTSAPEPDAGTDDHGDADQQETDVADAAIDRERDGRDEGETHTEHAVGVALLGGLVLGQPSEREDEP